MYNRQKNSLSLQKSWHSPLPNKLHTQSVVPLCYITVNNLLYPITSHFMMVLIDKI